jgi:8-amino-7-oxononanoate synthase
MADLPEKLSRKLQERKEQNSFRELRVSADLVDFVSNDYLGLSGDGEVLRRGLDILESATGLRNGSTGSRLLSGNSELFERTEAALSRYYRADACLIFNSGYDANLGLFSSVLQRGDLIFYDEYIHASMRDGIRMGMAKSYKYRHNDLEDLRKQLSRHRQMSGPGTPCYIATEAVFSMDGDQPEMDLLLALCDEYGCRLILDEAHAVKGSAMTTDLGQSSTFRRVIMARILTFGKAMGVQGAAVLCGVELKSYLVNFARSFIYTTALPPLSIASVLYVCEQMAEGKMEDRKEELLRNIAFFIEETERLALKNRFIPSNSAIHSCLIPGNTEVKRISGTLNSKGFDVRPILAPTVPEGMERLRFCLHSFNSRDEIREVLTILAHALEENVHT